ncbi:hypothetical protein PanWU01x14_031830 [Parasponia andersonii]|uniref:Uncharacterized protein n=1 Tax=Parasponia andersonii TaxID=3476 RepID=A0A2P5DU92_PARAD|nr:hypothetical protein PanWU01x14_031830 [Parasponia andersonii]
MQVNYISFENDCMTLDFTTNFIDTVQPVPPKLEDGGQATIDDLKELNHSIEDEPTPIFVSTLLTEKELQQYEQFLCEYKDEFT